MQRLLFSFFALGFGLSLSAQAPTPPSDLSGEALRDWLRINWYLPWHDELGYSEARVEMYGTIDNVDGMVECVYTGFSQAAAEVSFLDPINAEHTIPQTYFNSQEPMKSDIHHLFPTHGDANSRRGNLSFGEVVDTQADEWLIDDGDDIIQQSTIPTSNIDAYSEVHFNVDFEPREEQKGNTARAVFYFYTMYPQYMDQDGTLPAVIGEDTELYSWHLMDPPDAQEIERNERIQDSQGNYNPYIYSPELVGPAFDFVSSLSERGVTIGLYPNPATDQLTIDVAARIERYEIIDILGNEVALPPIQHGTIDISSLHSGVYLLKAITTQGSGVARFVRQ